MLKLKLRSALYWKHDACRHPATPENGAVEEADEEPHEHEHVCWGRGEKFAQPWEVSSSTAMQYSTGGDE